MRARLRLALLCGAAALLVGVPSASAFAPLSQIGSPGSGAGQLDGPFSLAVDPEGTVYVADLRNDRISAFGPQGAFLRAFGKDVGGPGQNICTAFCQPGESGMGGAAAQLNSYGVTVAGGTVYTGDTNLNRVSVFSASGDFLRAFGYDVIPGGGAGLEVCTYATSCQLGDPGGGAGQLDTPYGVAVGAGGNLYVADSNHRVSVFTPEGAFLRAFGYDVIPGGGTGLEVCTTVCQPGTAGGGAGQLAFPEGIATDVAGNVFVADDGNNRISVFDSQGSFLRAFGAFGVGAGQLDNPEGVGVDPAGNVLVGESGNNRVSVFDSQGSFLRAFGGDVDPGGGTGFEICTATCQAGVAGTGAGEFDSPSGVASDCRGSVYVSEVDGNRVQKLGEPGVRAPPCPSNAFSFGKVKKNKKKGTARLTVIVPGPGILRLRGTGLKPQRPATGALASKVVTGAGKVKLLIKSKGRKRKKLNRNGKVKVKAKVTYTPTNGDPNKKSKKIKLRKRLRHR